MNLKTKKIPEYKYHFIKFCFKPVKGRGTVGIFQNIIVVTIWLIVICMPLAILCGFINSESVKVNGILSVISNLCIGIVSSSLVALFTTVIQFKKEREMKWRQFNSIVFKLLAVLNRFSVDLSYTNYEEKELDYKLIKDFFEEYVEFGHELFWYNGKKEKAYNKLCIKLASLFALIYSDKYDIDTKQKKLNKKVLYSCIKYMSFLSQDYYQGTINVYDEMLNNMKNRL